MLLIAFSLPTAPQLVSIFHVSTNCGAVSYVTLTASVCPLAWRKLLKTLNFDSHSFVVEQMEPLVTLILKGASTDPDAAKRSLETLHKLARNELALLLVAFARKLLTNKCVVECSQDELDILLTPDDQLWHRDLHQQ